jgi:D-glycero-alpha-D-manno-heptose-7-phosphate kinase
MLISQTPFRISFVGGGSDLKEFYQNHGGAVLSTSINKYIFLSFHKYFHPTKSLLKYSNTEEISKNEEIKHKIIREVFKYFSIENVDFNSTADIPGGTGMGSSSAFTSGIINLCSNYKGISMFKHEIADLACKIEIDILGEPIGKQDQFACSVGGFNLIKFNQDETVNIIPLLLDSNDIKEIEENLILFYTGDNRDASSILTQQRNNTVKSPKVNDNLILMTKMAESLFFDLKNKNFDLLGEYLHESWILKKELSNNISNPKLDEIYNIAIRNGAKGGKLLGAGGGGFFLFYIKPENRQKLKNGLSFLREFEFKFEFQGTKIIFKN